MRKKAVPTKGEEVKNPDKLNLEKVVNDKRTNAEFIADAILGGGNVSNAGLIKLFHSNGKELDLDACVRTLKATAKKVSNGDNSDLEGILSAQVMALNSVFANLATSANNTNHLQQLETFMRLALKAQNQCRATIDTLVQIKNPRHTVITKQANISTGPQQVNNTLNQITEPETKISKNSESGKNQLLSHEQAERPYMDARAASQTSGDYPAMATLGKVNRADNTRRESDSCA
jgi:hypothetical protein